MRQERMEVEAKEQELDVEYEVGRLAQYPPCIAVLLQSCWNLAPWKTIAPRIL